MFDLDDDDDQFDADEGYHDEEEFEEAMVEDDMDLGDGFEIIGGLLRSLISWR